MSYSTVFWTVLVLLLAGGFLYSVLLWLRGRWEEKHQTQLGSLYDLAEDVMWSSEPAAVVRRMGEILPRITDCTHAAVWILDPASQQLELQAGTEEPVSVSLSLDSMSGAVTCFRNRVMTEVADAENCPFVSQETARHLGQKSLLYMPIIADGACLGVIEVEDRDRKRAHPALGLPWHRVLAAGGRIALPGHAGEEQRLRLKAEGVQFAGARVRMDLHRYTKLSRRFKRASRASRRESLQ